MHDIISKKTKIGCIFLTCAALLLTLQHFDVIIFTEFGKWRVKMKEVKSSPAFSDELEMDYHLSEDKRDIESNVILHWTPMFGVIHPAKDTSNGCIMTYNRSTIGFAKAVVFHFAELQDNPSSLPLAQRKNWQRWVWRCAESPLSTRFVHHKTLTPLNGIFNWTMTYRRDSDILSSYMYKVPSRENRTVAELIAQKTARSLGIWLVSNCAPVKRMKIIKELQKFMEIDIRGKCTGVPLCRGQCAFDTIRKYKFYFAFENSLCKEYITEKFFGQGLLGGAVPVVMGPPRGEYEEIAPPNSFIHVDDFETVEKLAEYLQELNENDAKYGNYLRWRSITDALDIKYEPNLVSPWVALCDKIKNEKIEPKTITNLATYWFGKGYDDSSTKLPLCQPEDGPSGIDSYRLLALVYTSLLVLCCLITLWYFR